jgi:hypothetical protein
VPVELKKLSVFPWRQIYGAIAPVVLGATLSWSAGGRQVPPRHDDVALYSAVIEQTIRPTTRAGAAQAVRVAGQTVAACTAPRDKTVPCISAEELQALAAVNIGKPSIFGTLIGESTRATLADSFAKENAESHDLPQWRQANIVVLDTAALHDESAKLSSPGATGFAGFSRPAYSQDGKAVVYAFYVCGNMCGYGWFVLLNRTDRGWRVQAAHPLWVS